MRARRLIGLIGGASLLVAVTGMAGTTGVKTAPAATVVPLLRFDPYRFAAAPTTATCVLKMGIACYSPKQLEAAYDMGPLYAKGLTGTGKTIVLVDSFGSPTITADLTKFDRTYGLQAPPKFTVIHPDGAPPTFNPKNAAMAGWAEETSLDVEYSHAMAPGANILLVETPGSGDGGSSSAYRKSSTPRTT